MSSTMANDTHNDTRGVGIESLKQFLANNPEYEVYDYSQLELWDQCPRKYSYRYVHGLHMPVDASATFSSTVVHPMVADFYKLGMNAFVAGVTGDNPATRRYWTTAFKTFNSASAGANQEPLTHKNTVVMRVEVWRNMAHQLASRIGHDPEIYEYVHHEIVYWRVLPEIANAVWISKPDVMLKRRHDDKPVTVEVKFSTWPFQRELNPFDRQILSQAWTANPIVQRKLFLHVVTNSRGEWEGNEVHPDVKPVDAVLLAEWLAEIQESVAYIKSAKRTGVFPKRAPRSCMDFNKLCKMVDLCRLGAGREFLMEGYDKEPPLGYLGL